MATLDSKETISRLDALRRRDKARRVFGANGHRYELEPPLTEAEVVAAEKQWGVLFPDDYRSFLLQVGSGGAGPGYGLFPLRRLRGVWRWKGDGADMVSDLRAPFPHSAAWAPTFRERGDDEDEDAYWAERDAWDAAIYFKPQQTDGAICICHEGCAIRDWLVVTGPERGNMWLDDRASDNGLSPHESMGHRVAFGTWYLNWLASAERELERPRTQRA